MIWYSLRNLLATSAAFLLRLRLSTPLESSSITSVIIIPNHGSHCVIQNLNGEILLGRNLLLWHYSLSEAISC
jgi:hypothetical protein